MRPDYQWIRNAGAASTIGLVLVLSIVIGFLIGYGLDRLLGTEPWLMILFTLLGVVAGFIEMFKIVLGMSKD
jgi:ATP synthase protein I